MRIFSLQFSRWGNDDRLDFESFEFLEIIARLLVFIAFLDRNIYIEMLESCAAYIGCEIPNKDLRYTIFGKVEKLVRVGKWPENMKF